MNTIILYLITLYTVFLVYKKLGLAVSVLFAYSLLMIDIIVIPHSIQFSSVFYIMFLSLIFIFNISENKSFSKTLIYIFFIIGCFTSFFDLLTSPLLTLGIPLTFVILLLHKKNSNLIRNDYIILMENSIIWGIGYGITWSTKWFIATYILKKD